MEPSNQKYCWSHSALHLRFSLHSSVSLQEGLLLLLSTSQLLRLVALHLPCSPAQLSHAPAHRSCSHCLTVFQ